MTLCYTEQMQSASKPDGIETNRIGCGIDYASFFVGIQPYHIPYIKDAKKHCLGKDSTQSFPSTAQDPQKRSWSLRKSHAQHPPALGQDILVKRWLSKVAPSSSWMARHLTTWKEAPGPATLREWGRGSLPIFPGQSRLSSWRWGFSSEVKSKNMNPPQILQRLSPLEANKEVSLDTSSGWSHTAMLPEKVKPLSHY